jgi:sialate O-acetylesterase
MALLSLLFGVTAARADVKLPPIFGNNMVLQRGMPVPVWGKANPGEEVTVAFLDQKQTTKAGADGNWLIKQNPLKEGGPHELVVSGKNTVKLTNVLVGEVWVCSGQSNMAWALKSTENAETEIAAANFPSMRLNGGGGWQAATPQTVGGFSGTGYYFGRDLHKALGVPIGLINRSVGGTSARLWTSKKAIEADLEMKPYLEDLFNPKNPKTKSNVGSLYESLIRPVIPFAIRGVIWYQGESDAGRPEEYQRLIKTMIRSWRSDWGQGDFPFLYVHLGAIGPAPKEPNKSAGWGPIREAQDKALELPNTGVAGFIDSDSDLHPRKKHIAGARLALAARAIAYGEKIVYSGPAFESMKVDGSKIIVKFRHVGGGLTVKGDTLRGFAIAGPDKNYAWADAVLDGDTVVLSSKAVSNPVHVRYAWASNPQATLYNREGLPALPFRVEEERKK